MDFRFTEDQLSIQSIARDFASRRIAPVAAELDAKGEFPLDNIREMGQCSATSWTRCTSVSVVFSRPRRELNSSLL